MFVRRTTIRILPRSPHVITFINTHLLSVSLRANNNQTLPYAPDTLGKKESQSWQKSPRIVLIRLQTFLEPLAGASVTAINCLPFKKDSGYSRCDRLQREAIQRMNIGMSFVDQHHHEVAIAPACARPVFEVASRSICLWATTRAITSRLGLDQSTAVNRTRTKQNHKEIGSFINKVS